MRGGQNPAKFVKDVKKAERITVAVLTYVPFLSGYYNEMLEVIKLCLSSLIANSDLPHDLMVFDNGSCREVQDYLREVHNKGHIQYLLLSDKNLGKGGAWNILMSGAPGEIIAYTDSDAYFYPGWLSRSVQLLETYPRVGMVTARPFRQNETWNTKTVAWAEKTRGVKIEKGEFINWETFWSFVRSLGNTKKQAREWFLSSQDIRLTYKNVPAIVGASHWQFTAHKKTLQEFLPFDMTRPMGQVRQLDERMNTAGYLKLMPTEALAQNMSNRVPEEFREFNKTSIILKSKPGTGLKMLKETPFIKKTLLAIYDRIFRMYYE
ncbi:MAG: glycosyltransferase family 2 protein [Anaerolineaceae bacterium]|nr:glycosyltransferase family 2 protein [Anaerolineaceae bacterium]